MNIYIIDHEKLASTAIVSTSTCQPLNLSLKNKLTQGFENFFEASYYQYFLREQRKPIQTISLSEPTRLRVEKNDQNFENYTKFRPHL